MRSFCEKTILCAISLFFLASCATTYTQQALYDPTEVMAPVGTSSMDPEEVQAILKEINERNRTVEDDPKWIKRSYKEFLVRRLNNVSEKEFKNYKQYLDNGALYILIHPAYFPFFHYPKKLSTKEEKISKNNIVERFLSLKPKDRRFEVMQAQERRTRDFLEFMSTREKLVIVVVPKNYREYAGYTYKRERDEYMRYFNEVTNFSRSILFADSRSPNRGYLTEEDALRLMEFLLSIDAKKVYIGGGYIGRCLEDFHALLTEDFGKEGIFLVPELSDISPRELSKSLAKAILKPDGSIDKDVANTFLKKDPYRIQDFTPDVEHLQ